MSGGRGLEAGDAVGKLVAPKPTPSVTFPDIQAATAVNERTAKLDSWHEECNQVLATP